MNTKSKVGRPSAQLVYPSTPFTIDQLFELNKGKVKWELSVRQHVNKEVARRGITKLAKTVTGQPHLLALKSVPLRIRTLNRVALFPKDMT